MSSSIVVLAVVVVLIGLVFGLLVAPLAQVLVLVKLPVTLRISVDFVVAVPDRLATRLSAICGRRRRGRGRRGGRRRRGLLSVCRTVRGFFFTERSLELLDAGIFGGDDVLETGGFNPVGLLHAFLLGTEKRVEFLVQYFDELLAELFHRFWETWSARRLMLKGAGTGVGHGENLVLSEALVGALHDRVIGTKLTCELQAELFSMSLEPDTVFLWTQMTWLAGK